jgi:peptidoglycan hydrolase-like protein with peptidoglycan-binding domain
MGPQSRLAIVAAQKNYGLVTDGIAGSQTIAALESGTRNVNIADKNREPASKTTTATTESKTSNKSDKDVLALQQLLANRGFYNGAVDGIQGNQTRTAIVAAQTAYGLAPDGVAGVQTMTALQRGTRPAPSATLKSINTPAANQPASQAVKVVAPTAKSTANNNDDVANLQNLLADRGFYKGQITGFLGPITKEAIVTAQKAYGLTPDGVAGSRTIAALEAGAPTTRQQITLKTVSPTVTPQPQLQPQIRVQPPQAAVSEPKAAPQATIQTPPKAQEAPKSQPTAASSTSDAQVLELQRLLTQRGFYNGKADGVLTAETRNSIVRAQNFYIISPADGSPSNKLIDSLSKDQFISSDGN